MVPKASFILGNGVGNRHPNTSSAISGREFESGIRTPVARNFVKDNIVGQCLEIRRSNTLSNPSGIHLTGRNCPDLEVVWSHKNLIQMLPNIATVPLIKVIRFICRNTSTSIQGRINQAADRFDLVFLIKHRNVVLERVGNPAALVADVGNTLVFIPVFVSGEGFLEAVVEILVVGEDDMASYVEEKALRGNVGRG